MEFETEIAVFPKSVVDAVQAIEDDFNKNGSKNRMIETEADWEIVEEMFDLYRYMYPDGFRVFLATQKKQRDNLKYEYGNVEKVGSSVEGQHMLNMPTTLYRFISKVYRNQKWDRKFAIELVKRMPFLSVPRKI